MLSAATRSSRVSPSSLVGPGVVAPLAPLGLASSSPPLSASTLPTTPTPTSSTRPTAIATTSPVREEVDDDDDPCSGDRRSGVYGV